MFTHFSCSYSEGSVEVETDQAKLTETSKQTAAEKSSEQVTECYSFLYFFLFPLEGFCDLFAFVSLLDLEINGKCLYKRLSVVYHLQLLADAQEEYDKDQKGKTLLNLVVIGKCLFVVVINYM